MFSRWVAQLKRDEIAAKVQAETEQPSSSSQSSLVAQATIMPTQPKVTPEIVRLQPKLPPKAKAMPKKAQDPTDTTPIAAQPVPASDDVANVRHVIKMQVACFAHNHSLRELEVIKEADQRLWWINVPHQDHEAYKQYSISMTTVTLFCGADVW